MPRARDPLILRTFGGRVRALRHSRGMTQDQLAVAVDLQTPGISRIETGQAGVSLTTAAQLAEALGVPLSELFSENVPKRTTLLDAEEEALVARWRGLDDRARHVVRTVIDWAYRSGDGNILRELLRP
jgi:transcriptional regulator with XRE-family HTH domain